MKTVETYCGSFTFDDRSGTVVETFSPGHKALLGKAGRGCETCLHWQLRRMDPSWRLAEDCPCFECAGMGYGDTGDLLFWVRARKPRGGLFWRGRAERRAARVRGLPARSRRISLFLFQCVYRDLGALRRRLGHA